MLPCQDLLGRVNSARIKLNPTVQDFWCLSFCWSPSKGCNCIIKLKIDKGTFKSAPHLWFQLVTTYIVLFQNCSIPGISFWVDIVWLWACPSKCRICHLWLCHCLLLFSPQPESILQSRKTEIDQVVQHLWKIWRRDQFTLPKPFWSLNTFHLGSSWSVKCKKFVKQEAFDIIMASSCFIC